MTGAVVLAAGKGSRLGSPKALATSKGGTFLESVLRTLREAGIEEVRVVLSSALAETLVPDPVPRARVVVNPDPSRGMLSSILCGLDALPRELEAVVVWPVDHPRVRAATIRALVEAQRIASAAIVVPTHDGVRGHPVVFGARALPELEAAPAALGARAVVRAHPDRLELPVDDAGVVDDIDSPADYERAFGRAPGVPGAKR